MIQESLIVDFFEYFREPWALAIFYDKFDCLRVENRATLLSKTVREREKKKEKETRKREKEKNTDIICRRYPANLWLTIAYML